MVFLGSVAKWRRFGFNLTRIYNNYFYFQENNCRAAFGIKQMCLNVPIFSFRCTSIYPILNHVKENFIRSNTILKFMSSWWWNSLWKLLILEWKVKALATLKFPGIWSFVYNFSDDSFNEKHPWGRPRKTWQIHFTLPFQVIFKNLLLIETRAKWLLIISFSWIVDSLQETTKKTKQHTEMMQTMFLWIAGNTQNVWILIDSQVTGIQGILCQTVCIV